MHIYLYARVTLATLCFLPEINGITQTCTYLSQEWMGWVVVEVSMRSTLVDCSGQFLYTPTYIRIDGDEKLSPPD